LQARAFEVRGSRVFDDGDQSRLRSLQSLSVTGGPGLY
jgi:hypothetical protein